jgi:hypothetical protein
MGQDTGKQPAQDQSAHDSPNSQQSAQDQPIQDQPIQDQSIQDQSILGGALGPSPDAQVAHDQTAADDLLHAAHVPPPDMVANVELTLDHLSTTVDLFDVPPFDYGDTGGGDTG